MCCKVRVLQSACIVKCTCGKVHLLQSEHVAKYKKPLEICSNLYFRNLWNINLENLSNLNKKNLPNQKNSRNLSNTEIYQNNERNVSNTDISQQQKTHYKSPCSWIKSSVSSMISAEEGQPPSNEPEEWQDTHPLSPLRWGTTLLTRQGPLHFHSGDGGILKIARVANKGDRQTDRQTNKQTHGVTSSLLQLLVASKNTIIEHWICC